MPDRDTVIASVPTGLWVGGEQVPAVDGRTFSVFDPADGQVLTEVAAAGSADGARALDAAVKAQPEWAATPARERAEMGHSSTRWPNCRWHSHLPHPSAGTLRSRRAVTDGTHPLRQRPGCTSPTNRPPPLLRTQRSRWPPPGRLSPPHRSRRHSLPRGHSPPCRASLRAEPNHTTKASSSSRNDVPVAPYSQLRGDAGIVRRQNYPAHIYFRPRAEGQILKHLVYIYIQHFTFAFPPCKREGLTHTQYKVLGRVYGSAPVASHDRTHGRALQHEKRPYLSNYAAGERRSGPARNVPDRCARRDKVRRVLVDALSPDQQEAVATSLDDVVRHLTAAGDTSDSMS